MRCIPALTSSRKVSTPLPPTAGDQQLAIQRAIDGLAEGGVTNMEAGLRRAYELGRAARAAGRANVRIVLFTDTQPNVGATTPTQFAQLVTEGAASGVYGRMAASATMPSEVATSSGCGWLFSGLPRVRMMKITSTWVHSDSIWACRWWPIFSSSCRPWAWTASHPRRAAGAC